MENASKALIIAGSVLIALLVISLLVMFYDNIKEMMNTNEKVDLVEQVTEFNKQYDVYYRNNLHGSDILSLANKVNDYNIREAGEEGYQELTMKITFKSKTDVRENGKKLTTVIHKGDTWDSKDLQLLIEDEVFGWNSIIKELETNQIYNEAGKGYTIQYFSGLRRNQLEETFKEGFPGYNKDEIQTLIDKYLSYKSALNTLKSKTFKATHFGYDDKTGRVILMEL